MASKKPKFIQKLRGSFRSRSQSPALLPGERADALVDAKGPSTSGHSDEPDASPVNIRSTTDSNVPDGHGTEPLSRTTDAQGEDGGIEPTSIRPAPIVENLWDKAYRCLAKGHPKLVKDYERILVLEEAESAESNIAELIQNPSVSNGITQAHSRLTELASKKLATVEESRANKRLGSKTVAFKDGVDQVVAVVIAAKDFVSKAVASEPHAALA